ncbi:MAG TPA: IS1595 family transposase, partial [Candidatus Margulisiibacteriota bacterium]|nr:IS1595 family transposase [Candidatus Margulisiibacteriota bacterium]
MKTRKVTETTGPTSLMEVVRYFSDPDVCLDWMVKTRWPKGVTCPRCSSANVGFLKNDRRWKCYAKHADGSPQKFSAKVGTIFEDSPIGLDKWFVAIWLLGNCKNGISSYEIARDVKVTQKTAWFMLQRIRKAMQRGSFEKIGGEVEADETFVGGKARNMHAWKRTKKITGTGGEGKEIVLGLLERETGKVRVKHIGDRKKKTLQGEVKANVEKGADVFTDDLASYTGLDAEYVHGVVNHAEKYVEGRIHTNGLENFWSLLKRSIKGTYV